MKILVFGDISTWNINNFSIDKINPFFVKQIKQADYVIYNLEGPICKTGRKYSLQIRENKILDFCYKLLLKITGKEQPIVFSSEEILELLKLNKNTVVTLANNHIKDLGKKGFEDTLELLKKNNIKFIGAGLNNLEASNDLIMGDLVIINTNFVGSKKNGFNFKIYNALNNEFGASYQNLEELKKKINIYKKLKKKTILIIHGGKEMPVNNKNIGIDIEEIKKLNSNISIIHHFHKYVKTKYEKDNLFCLGDFIFNRKSVLQLYRKSIAIKINITHKLTKKKIVFKISDGYCYD